MEFIIDRVSGDTPPCEGAVLGEVTHTHQRPCHFSDKFNASLRRVEKHNFTYRIENGVHKWDVTFSRWTIEINTLEGLVALQEMVGDLILKEGNHLTIYDSYIE